VIFLLAFFLLILLIPPRSAFEAKLLLSFSFPFQLFFASTCFQRTTTYYGMFNAFSIEHLDAKE